MTEAEWLACMDPGRMLAWMRRPRGPFLGASTGDPKRPNVEVSDRKLRLFAIAVARHGGCGTWASVGHLLAAAEGMAEGVPHELTERDIEQAQQYVASWLIERDAAGVARRILQHYEPDVEDREAGPAQAALLRDVVGNPWRLVRPHQIYPPGQYLLERRAAIALAHTIYDTRDWRLLPVLADALEDAGCTSAEVLAHLRGPGPDADPTPWEHRARADNDVATMAAEFEARLRGPVHARGCWVLDLVLGKE